MKVFFRCAMLACLGLGAADAGNYRLHTVPAGLHNKAPPATSAEDVRSDDKPLLAERLPRGKGAEAPEACRASALAGLPDKALWAAVETALAGSTARACRQSWFAADAATTVRLFQRERLQRFAHALREVAPGRQAAAVQLLRAGTHARHRADLPFVLPEGVAKALATRLARPALWQPEAADDLAETLLLADALRLDSAAFFDAALRALDESDALLASVAGRRRVFAAQVWLQSRQHDPAFQFPSALATRWQATLTGFLQRHATVWDQPSGFLLSNAGALLAGGLSRPALQPALLPALALQLQGMTAADGQPLSALPRHLNKAWARMADVANQYAPQHCQQLGVCDPATGITARALPIRHACSQSLVIRAQEMGEQQLQESCAKLLPMEAAFHARMRTGGQPVADDQNTSLDVVVFDDWTEYDVYATALYQISTDNGGMYLEGKPDQAGNQARFVSHEADWLRPAFVVWNLEHEYIHYLDARFNLAGNYEDTLAWPLVWWQEGLAEVFAKGDHNPEALSAQNTRQMPLSQILQTPVTPWDGERVYRLGYLAARFLLDHEPERLQAWRALLREKRFADYKDAVRAYGDSGDAAFANWWRALPTEAAKTSP